MNKADFYFFENMKRLMDTKSVNVDENPRARYGDGTLAFSHFITQVYEEYDISKNEFPLITLRKIPVQSSIKEIFWIYQDQTSDLEVLEKKYGVTWWREWESKSAPGTIGNRYGYSVKKFDQINKLISELKTNAYSRRHIISLWDMDSFSETDGLLPCAYETIWSVRSVKGVKYLDATLIQRSSDYLVANHVNKIQYVALQMMLAHVCDMKPGKFAHFVQNLHIYNKHRLGGSELMRRTPAPQQPILKLKPDTPKDFYQIGIDNFELLCYNIEYPRIKFDLAI
jgi:thymidylate synthase